LRVRALVKEPDGAPACKFPATHFEFPACCEELRHGDFHVRRVTPGPRFPGLFVNRDPRWALSQELEAKQPLLALAAEDPDFLIDLIEGETNHRGSRRLDPR
jgi:hypothetical protein